MIHQTVQVIYTCGVCDVREAKVNVPARTTEDMKTWTDATILLLMRNHAEKSPLCNPGKFKEVKIPVTGAEHIGGVNKETKQ